MHCHGGACRIPRRKARVGEIVCRAACGSRSLQSNAMTSTVGQRFSGPVRRLVSHSLAVPSSVPCTFEIGEFDWLIMRESASHSFPKAKA